MEDKRFEEVMQATMDDLKLKMIKICAAADDVPRGYAHKALQVRDKAVVVLKEVTEKIETLSSEDLDREGILASVKKKSDDLYYNAMGRIDEIRRSALLEQSRQQVNRYMESARAEISNIANSEEVKEAVDKAREGTIDVAEKALEVLKDWLTPEGDDQ